MNNIAYTLSLAIIIIALPACCGSKKKCYSKVKDDNVVTLQNTIDTLSIELVEEGKQENAETVNNKF